MELDNHIIFTDDLDAEKLEWIELVMEQNLNENGLHCALIVDMAGNVIAIYDKGDCQYDLYSLAALASANYSAVDSMARILGEKEFSILFQKGKKENIHFSKINGGYLLITVFDNQVSIGLLRLRIDETVKKIGTVFHRQ